MKRIRCVAAVLVIAVAGCGGDPDGPAGAPPDPTIAAPDGSNDAASAGDPTGSWVLVAGPSDPIPGWDVTVTIDGDQITGTAACNGYGGTVDFGDDGSMSVSELGNTEMGCEAPVQDLEQTFLASLTTVMSYSVGDGRLELVAADGTWTFEAEPEVRTADLVGTTWVLDGYLSGDSVSNEPGMDDAWIELADDGTVVGATNCRELSGTWLESGAEVYFDTFGADGECADDADWDLDGRIIGVLGDGFRPVIDGDRLTVTSQGDVGLTYRAGERPAPPTTATDDGDESASSPDPAGGVDGPVMYWREDASGVGEDALIEGVLVVEGDCVYLAGPDARPDDPTFDRYPVLWRFGTTWQDDPAGIVLPSGGFAAVGDTVSAGGGYYAADGPDSPSNAAITRFTTSADVAERAAQCALGEFREVAVVQHSVEVTAD